MHKLTLLAALVTVFFPTCILAEEKRLNSVEFLELARMDAEAKCKSVEALASLVGDSDSPNAGLIRQSARMHCECTPRGVEDAKSRIASGDLPESVTAEELESILLPAIERSCAAEAIRQSFGSGCSKAFETKVPDSSAYCACMAPKIAELTDEQLYLASIQAKKDFDAKVAAQEAGVEPPQTATTTISEVESECLRQ